MSFDTPYISADSTVSELTWRGVALAIILTCVLATSNAYLALKLGFLTSASIPAAMISIGILRFFKGSSILENNAVQTAASAGEAVAGGIVYTIPGLILIHYWYHFDYFTNFFIALCGGVLGVLFSIPLRKLLVNDHALRFPEGRAIAAVLKSAVEKTGLRDLLYGGVIGGTIELLQLGFKIMASSFSHWFVVKRILVGFGMGFSPIMIGAGFLIGQDMAISVFLGAVISWLIALPVVGCWFPEIIAHASPNEAVVQLWNSEMRYLGIGAMLLAGCWTFALLLRPLFKSVYGSYVRHQKSLSRVEGIVRTDRDIPSRYRWAGVGGVLLLLWVLFQRIFPLEALGFSGSSLQLVIGFAVLYVAIFGFLFSVMTAYFSGMVGVSASPGSSVVIAGMLLAAGLLLGAIHYVIPLPLTADQIKAAEAITIIIGAVVTGIAAIANDNSQDLKVGQLVGATPWKQQLMLLLGVLVSSLVIPFVMQLMFNVYGIAGVMPHEGMDVSQSLPAPTAALLAAVTEAVFQGDLPWGMMLIGASIIAALLILNRLLGLQRFVKLSMLGVAIGMYLPLASSFPLFIGGMIGYVVQRFLRRARQSEEMKAQRVQRGVLIACGLVAGSALMDVLLAIVFSMMHGPDSVRLVGDDWEWISVGIGLVSTVTLAYWIKRRVCDNSLMS